MALSLLYVCGNDAEKWKKDKGTLEAQQERV